MSVNTRRLCLDILSSVMDDGIYCNTALHECLNQNPALDIKERAFLSILSEGVVERCIEMDYIIDKFSSKPVDRLKPVIRNILRMAVYQIMYMDQVPDSATVNEAVKLTVKKGYGGLRGFVNGLLRNIVRNRDKIEYPDADSNILEYISVKYSMPEWLVRHFLKEMSTDDVIATMEYYMNATDTVLRVRGDSGSVDLYISDMKKSGLSFQKGHIFDYAFRLRNAGKIDELPGYSDGRFAVQDESSMIPGHIAISWIKRRLEKNGDKTVKVLDMCAAPGGKTLHIAGEFGDKVSIDSCDISEHKVKRIRENALRLRLDNINAYVCDALKADDTKKGKYDVVIADLPCSGLGVIARKPDIKYNITEASMKELAVLQQKMLDNASSYLAPGGLLIYSTCTINSLENENNALYFSENHREYKLCSPEKYFDAETLERISDAITEQSFIRVIPGLMRSDGFFVAVFEREG